MSIEEQVEAIYEDFFGRAERTRRWRVDEDLPWEEARPGDPTLVVCAEMFCALEEWLPDYSAAGVSFTRERFGQAWFTAAWAYEESKHALALERYLVRTGARTAEDIRQLRRQSRTVPWASPFHTTRQMTFYGALQETTTLVSYLHQARAAREKGDRLLAEVYRRIARDEAAHATFYIDVARVLLADDPDGALGDLALVFRRFTMPGPGLPGWDAHVDALRAQGLDQDRFLAHAWLPTLRRLGVSRRALLRALPAAEG